MIAVYVHGKDADCAGVDLKCIVDIANVQSQMFAHESGHNAWQDVFEEAEISAGVVVGAA